MPLLQRKWVKAAILSGLLLGIVVGVYFAARPPSAEKLAAKIDSSTSEDGKLEAATRYLELYGDKADPNTDKAVKVFREAKVREREKQLAKRFGVEFHSQRVDLHGKAGNLEENAREARHAFYRDLIENAKASGTDYWQIWHLLAFDPEAAHHLAALSQTLMHKECPISAGLRELIAAYIFT